ncbi:MAG: 30S ribosomal protein S18 [Patescibacteria group bacterium]
MQSPRRRKNSSCFYCEQGREVDYKDTLQLRRFLTRRGKIRPREQTGLCAQHQRAMAKAVKQARMAGLLPFLER